jgi:hypothetical protein
VTHRDCLEAFDVACIFLVAFACGIVAGWALTGVAA